MKRILLLLDEPQYMEWRSYYTRRHYDTLLQDIGLSEQNLWLQERDISIGMEHVRHKRNSEPWIATTIFVWLDDEQWTEYRLVWG